LNDILQEIIFVFRKAIGNCRRRTYVILTYNTHISTRCHKWKNWRYFILWY